MKKKIISIIDYGIGNILSISRAVEFNGYKARYVDRPEDIFYSDSVILPGVGAFKKGMEKIKKKIFTIQLLKSQKKEHQY